MVAHDDWSDLGSTRRRPEIDMAAMHAYRMGRLKQEMARHDVSLCVLFSPISLRYALDYRNYAAFMSHIPSTYLFLPLDGPYMLYNAFDPTIPSSNKRTGHPVSYFYGGEDLEYFADELAKDITGYLAETGSGNRRVAVEYVNPSVTLALDRRGIEVIDGVLISERARLIKCEEEISCIRWSMAVAEHGAAKVREALRPGVSEVQLWALLNYANLANNGDWHDGRMLASGPRINPWLQEASERKLEAGDLVGFDTDMIGPMGYFADLSRTLFCGPGKPSSRQKQLYRLALAEIRHNLELIRPGNLLSTIQQQAYPVPEEFHKNAYPCIVHGIGMCDEYPNIPPGFRSPVHRDEPLQPGMVLCVESYMGEQGERDGVKLEQQVLVTDTGHELISTFPFEEELM